MEGEGEEAVAGFTCEDGVRSVSISLEIQH